VTKEANTLMMIMIRELGTCKYLYKEIIEGCYDTYINNNHITKPSESKEAICDKVLDVFNNNFKQ
jgi:hypothetical protein